MIRLWSEFNRTPGRILLTFNTSLVRSRPRFFNIIFTDKIRKTRIVTAVARGLSSISGVNPMAVAAYGLAAVTTPLTLSCSAQIVPAPVKPIPATMPTAIRAG